MEIARSYRTKALTLLAGAVVAAALGTGSPAVRHHLGKSGPPVGSFHGGRISGDFDPFGHELGESLPNDLV
jgi:hypothetical protein